MTFQPARVQVPASTSNLGAGFDCLGLALDRYLVGRFEPGPDRLRLERGGTLASITTPAADDLIVRVFRDRVVREGWPEPTGVLSVDSEIPVARGLGSSAAAVVAATFLAVAATRGVEADRSAALREVEAWEGHPDNAAPAIFGGLVGVARDATGHAHPIRLDLSASVAFAFAAPGRELSTRVAREVLPRAVSFQDAVRALGRLTGLVRGLATGDPALLAIGFDDLLHVPYRLPLIPGGADAIDAAVTAGGWAATVSGSGSGLIAVCPPDRADEVAAAMADAFRHHAGPDGVVAFAAKPDTEGARLGRVSSWR